MAFVRTSPDRGEYSWVEIKATWMFIRQQPGYREEVSIGLLTRIAPWISSSTPAARASCSTWLNAYSHQHAVCTRLISPESSTRSLSRSTSTRFHTYMHDDPRLLKLRLHAINRFKHSWSMHHFLADC